jgi:uncharacterized protein (DUF488 family)
MSRSTAQPPSAVFTIGHSTRSIEDFLELLRVHGVTCLLDVRTVPRSLIIHTSIATRFRNHSDASGTSP